MSDQEKTEDPTAAEGFVGVKDTYAHAANETEVPKYSSDEEEDFYKRFTESQSEQASPFDKTSTLNKLKEAEAERAESSAKPLEEPGPLKPGENKGPGQDRPSLPKNG